MPPGPPISLGEAKKSLADGELRPDQMAWCRGLSDWKPLGEVIDYVERKTSGHLPAIADTSMALPASGPTLAEQAAERAGLSPSAPEQAPAPPPVPTTTIPSWSRFRQAITPSDRGKKLERLNSEQMGEKLWAFAKQLTRDFRGQLEQRFKETAVRIGEEQEFNYSQELLVFHLWLVSKVLDGKPRAVEAMNRRYVLRQSEIAESYEHHAERVEYMRAVKEAFSVRFDTYQNAWNFHSPKAQTIAAACLLKNLFGPTTFCTKPVENLLVSYINAYLTKLPRTAAAYAEQFDIVD